MYYKAFFSNKSKAEIKCDMQEEGFSPKVVTDIPGFIYEPHQHPETKYLVCLEGSMKVTVKGTTYNFESGDKLVILGNTQHSAVVGKNGCVYFWSEKLVSQK